MPDVRPFRALRYASEAVPGLAAVVAPPYDVIGPHEQARLLARDPHNVVRLDLPAGESGEDSDERYRRAARTLALWRGEGVLRADPRPALTVYEQEYGLPGTAGPRRIRTGFFARVRLESFGPGAGIRRHERTLSAPREDRYRLLRATAVNTSPVVGLYEDAGATAARAIRAVTTRPPSAELIDDAGTRHRTWVVPDDEPAVATLCGAASAGPITIADGHHRYETALRYRDERRVGAPPGPEGGYESVLMLLLEPGAGPVDVLATHRILRGLGPDGLARLEAGFGGRFRSTRTDDAAGLLAAFRPGAGPGGRGRFGLWTRSGGRLLEAIAPGGRSGRAVEHLDVSVLGRLLEEVLGLDAAAVANGELLAYAHDAAEAVAAVEAGRDGADAAFLLEGTPASAILAVAADGDVMPQKSTYIYPKALTGLVINPLEW